MYIIHKEERDAHLDKHRSNYPKRWYMEIWLLNYSPMHDLNSHLYRRLQRPNLSLVYSNPDRLDQLQCNRPHQLVQQLIGCTIIKLAIKFMLNQPVLPSKVICGPNTSQFSCSFWCNCWQFGNTESYLMKLVMIGGMFRELGIMMEP